ncbi:hypothetical protein HSR6_0980 [Halodesulfurarchaeum formicicum]|uniref:Uncharacterized protein n=1 Tax=Halodesulfurarchaeum formicicum TaxID=1873524 RepID=A0A1J1ACY9_9EURY|nr:hypothetical protein HSR6_0980 [Halodesulfurarchaeum formicicum]
MKVGLLLTNVVLVGMSTNGKTKLPNLINPPVDVFGLGLGSTIGMQYSRVLVIQLNNPLLAV